MKRIANYLFYVFLVFLSGICYVSVRAQDAQDTVDFIFKKVAKDDFNGSAYTIRGEDLQNMPITNLTNLLSGLVPGYFSVQTSGGTVNESPGYRIRGTRTSAEGVLVLVDGQERDFGILSPHEVESVTILKDAVASALYGTRASNGIILVKTKKGEQGKPRIELTAQLINQEPIGLLKPLDAAGYAEHYSKALKNDGQEGSIAYSEYYLQQYRNKAGVNGEYYPDINWLDEYFKKSSWVQRYNLAISGGSKVTNYFINAGYLNQAGMFKLDKDADYAVNNQTGRFNLRSNLEIKVTSSTQLNLDLYGWLDKQNRPGGDSYGAYNALVTTPANAFPAYYIDNGGYMDENGNIVKGINGKIAAGNSLQSNPWALLNRNGYSVLNNNYGSFRAKLIQDLPFITPGLKVSASLSMDSYTSAVTDRRKGYAYYQLTNINNPSVLKKTNTDDRMNNSVTDRNSYGRNSLNLQLSYSRKLQEHTISALAFYDQFEYSDQVSIPNRFQTIGSWLSYNYAKRYAVDLVGSYQGVYKFAPGKQFGFFPTVAAGWTVSNEDFFKGASGLVSYLKLRASYGQVGNQRGVNAFYYKGRLSEQAGVYNFGNNMGAVGGYVENIIANPNLTWEKSRQFNAAADIRLLNDRFQYSIDYFRDHRYDMYMSNSNVAPVLGLQASILENIGEMKSNGIEMSGSWNDHIGKVNYTIGGMYSFSENTVLKTGEITQPYPWLQSAGYASGVQRGYVALGLFQSYEEIAAAPKQNFSEVHPGDIRYKDINGDGIIDVNDVVPIGYSTIPGVFYGFNLGLSYKGLGINALFQGAAHVSRYLSGKVAYPFVAYGNIYEHQLDYWTPENPDATLPRISTVSSNVNNSQASSFWVKDASYLRLKTLELYYELPGKLLKGSFIDNLRVFASGYNLHVWTPFKGPLDPEDDGSSNSMPLTRNISLGLSMRF